MTLLVTVVTDWLAFVAADTRIRGTLHDDDRGYTDDAHKIAVSGMGFWALGGEQRLAAAMAKAFDGTAASVMRAREAWRRAFGEGYLQSATARRAVEEGAAYRIEADAEGRLRGLRIAMSGEIRVLHLGGAAVDGFGYPDRRPEECTAEERHSIYEPQRRYTTAMQAASASGKGLAGVVATVKATADLFAAAAALFSGPEAHISDRIEMGLVVSGAPAGAPPRLLHLPASPAAAVTAGSDAAVARLLEGAAGLLWSGDPVAPGWLRWINLGNRHPSFSTTQGAPDALRPGRVDDRVNALRYHGSSRAKKRYT